MPALSCRGVKCEIKVRPKTCLAALQGEVPEGKKGFFELPVFNYYEVGHLYRY